MVDGCLWMVVGGVGGVGGVGDCVPGEGNAQDASVHKRRTPMSYPGLHAKA